MYAWIQRNKEEKVVSRYIQAMARDAEKQRRRAGSYTNDPERGHRDHEDSRLPDGLLEQAQSVTATGSVGTDETFLRSGRSASPNPAEASSYKDTLLRLDFVRSQHEDRSEVARKKMKTKKARHVTDLRSSDEAMRTLLEQEEDGDRVNRWLKGKR